MLRRILILIISLSFLSPIYASDRIERNFEVRDGGLLTVRAERGSIDVVSGLAGGVNIEIVLKHWSREEFLDEFDVDFRQNGSDVELVVDGKRSWRGWFNWGQKGFEIRAEVPSVYNVDLKTSGGSISVDDLTGEVRSRTSGGSLSFGRIEGPVDGKTSGGSINLKECYGNADIHTSGGSITVGDVDGSVHATTSGGSISIARSRGSVVAKTSGGGIKVEDVIGSLEASTSGGSIRASMSNQPEGDCRLTTSGGGITLAVAPDLAFDLDAKTSGGRVRTENRMDLSGEIKKSRVNGRLNGGGPRLYLRTSGGDIRIQTAG